MQRGGTISSGPFNLLTEPALYVSCGEDGGVGANLPEVLALLSRADDVVFTGLQAHQEHPWHAFCVQLAALALARAKQQEAPVDADRWRALLRDLTEGRDEPWQLVVDDLRRPAFLQAPLPGGTLQGFKDADSPSDLDVLVTSKNHDVKARRICAARPEHWIYALVTLQTFEGFLGAGNYGVSRMNGGFASRPLLGRDGGLGSGARFRRDTTVLLETRAATAHDRHYKLRGHGLLWLLPWDGSDSVSLLECDPHFIEICRRVRLVWKDGQIQGRRSSSKAARVDGKANKGDTGDAWTPVDREAGKALTVSGNGFDYRLLHDLLLSDSYVESPAMKQRPGDTVLRAAVLVRGQGETQGLHRRVVPVPAKMRRILGDPYARLTLGARSKDRLQVVETVSRRMLHPALCALQQGAPEKLKLDDKRDRSLLAELDREIDRIYFEQLFQDAALPPEDAARRWQGVVIEQAERVLRRAVTSLPIPQARYYRAVVAAERIFYGTARKQFPDLYEHRKEATSEPGSDQPVD
jgi:CRISPR system Cascade subunit CasA